MHRSAAMQGPMLTIRRSLTRQDAALVPDQGAPDQQLVDQLLSEATGKAPDGGAELTIPDLSRGTYHKRTVMLLVSSELCADHSTTALSKRRADARKTNKQYAETFFHNVFGASKCVAALPSCNRDTNVTRSSSTMLTIFGGRISDLTPMLKEERFADNWEPRVLDRFGLTMAKFNATVLPVEHGVDVKKYQ